MNSYRSFCSTSRDSSFTLLLRSYFPLRFHHSPRLRMMIEQGNNPINSNLIHRDAFSVR